MTEIQDNTVAAQIEAQETGNARKWIRRVIYTCFMSFYLAVVVAHLIVFFGIVEPDSLLSTTFIDHYAAIAGLPCAALMAFAVVWSYRSTDGPFEIEAWGLKFKGAAGPIVMWVLVFIVSVTAIKLLY
jgi:hypothetical protein